MLNLADKQTSETLPLTPPAYGHKWVALALGWGHNKAQRLMTKYRLRPPRRRAKKWWLTQSVAEIFHLDQETEFLTQEVVKYREDLFVKISVSE